MTTVTSGRNGRASGGIARARLSSRRRAAIAKPTSTSRDMTTRISPSRPNKGHVNGLHRPAPLAWTSLLADDENAVNLTDGLDGLAIGCTITVAFGYALLSYAAGNFRIAEYLQVPFYPFAGELTVVCSALVGAGLGFLWFNCHPAKVFMGDTGSLAIGGMIGVVAICCKQELLLIVVGGVFVIEAISVILQVISFKLTGRRIFVMSPLHHHFELTGWKENTVIVRFWILSIIFALLGLATLKLR